MWILFMFSYRLHPCVYRFSEIGAWKPVGLTLNGPCTHCETGYDLSGLPFQDPSLMGWMGENLGWAFTIHSEFGARGGITGVPFPFPGSDISFPTSSHSLWDGPEQLAEQT